MKNKQNLHKADKAIKRKFPTKSELEKAAKVIHSKEHIYFVDFSHTVTKFVNLTARKTGTNRLSITVMAELAINQGSLRPTDLSRFLYVSGDGITKVIDKLEKQGYIARVHIDKDRRTIHAKLTIKGLNTLMQIINHLDIYWENIFDVLSSDERKALNEILKKLTKQFSAEIKNLSQVSARTIQADQ
ncbi:MAG: MarR family winged helix-turn-helix transcriptional regulator [Dehalococcoidia bacterium]